MEKKNKDLLEPFPPGPSIPGSLHPESRVAQIDVELEMSKIETFFNFCRHLLGRQTRPAEIFHTADNFGIKLTDGESFVISMALEEPAGSMQPAHAMPVTGLDYPEMMGSGAVPVTRPAHAIPTGTEDRTINQGSVDKTEAQPARRMDQ